MTTEQAELTDEHLLDLIKQVDTEAVRVPLRVKQFVRLAIAADRALLATLKVEPAAPVEPADWLQSEEFYNAMQAYRCAPREDQVEVIGHFENVKWLIRDWVAASPLLPAEGEAGTASGDEAVPPPGFPDAADDRSGKRSV